MHAWMCHNPVGTEALQWQELPTPAPAAGQALVAVKASSLNFPDILICQNKYQFKPTPPFVPGSEFAGVVEAVGDGVTDDLPAIVAALCDCETIPMPDHEYDRLSSIQIDASGRVRLDSARYGAAWQGSLFVGSLKFGTLHRLEVAGGKVQREEKLLQGNGERIRDVRQGPDGLLYMVTDSPQGRLLRFQPD